MPAFTHLCQKINISLFDDTITVYPKMSIPKVQPGLEYVISFLQPENFLPIEVVNLFTEEHRAELGFMDTVHRGEPEHDQYHNDHFSHDDTHFHFRYSKTIDEAQFREILAVYARYNLISKAEETAVLAAYRQAALNDLPIAAKPPIKKPVVPVPAIVPAISMTSAGNPPAPNNKPLATPTRAMPASRTGNISARPAVSQQRVNTQKVHADDTKLREQLDLIANKAAAFRIVAEKNPNFLSARDAAETLHQRLNTALDNYNATPQTKATHALFQQHCRDAIDEARPVLEKHRGWKKILGNIGLAVAGLGIGYVVAGLINLKINKQFLFFSQTDSCKKVDMLADSIQNHPAPAA